MKLKIIYILIFTLLVASKAQSVYAQNIHDCMQQADSFMQNNNSQAAYTLYDRIWHFASNKEKQDISQNYLTSAFKTERFSSSLNILQFLKNQTDTEIGSDQKLMEVAAHFNLENWDECMQVIDEYATDSIDGLQANLSYFSLLCALKTNQNERMQTSINQLKKYASESKQKSLDSLYQAYQQTQFVLPNKAKILSLLVPGLGQVYQKEYSQAANAFTLNALLIGASILTAHFYNWPQAALFWAFYVPHYYFGNARSARDMAHQKNTKIEEERYLGFKNWELN